jgi:hypothetical protein
MAPPLTVAKPENRPAIVPVRVLDIPGVGLLPRAYLTRQELEFVVPLAVKKAFDGSTYLKFGFSELLQTAIKGKFVTLAEENFGEERPLEKASGLKLTLAEYSVLCVARNRQDNGFDVGVVTSSQRLQRACRDAGIKTIGLFKFRASCLRRPSDLAVQTVLRDVRVNFLKGIVHRCAAGLVVGAITLLILPYGSAIYKEVTEVKWVGVLVCLVVAVLAFMVRSRSRFYYAIVEIAVGVFVVLTAMPTADKPSPDGLKAAGGIYVIVRGMDNLSKALAGSLLGLWWRGLFGE